MESDHMKEALRSRRGKGIDVSIILGPHAEPEQGEKGVQPTTGEYHDQRKHETDIDQSSKSDLAPMPDHPLDKDHAAGVPAMDPMGNSPLSELHDGDLIGGMSDGDKKDVSERAPRSLMERARKAMIEKYTQKKA